MSSGVQAVEHAALAHGAQRKRFSRVVSESAESERRHASCDDLRRKAFGRQIPTGQLGDRPTFVLPLHGRGLRSGVFVGRPLQDRTGRRRVRHGKVQRLHLLSVGLPLRRAALPSDGRPHRQVHLVSRPSRGRRDPGLRQDLSARSAQVRAARGNDRPREAARRIPQGQGL